MPSSGTDLGHMLDDTRSSALAPPEAVPAALLSAATGLVPITAAFDTVADWDMRRRVCSHQACRAMMGACIGAARRGRLRIMDRDATASGHPGRPFGGR